MKHDYLATIREKAYFVGMKLLIILYAVCVVTMLTAYIILLWKAKNQSNRPWYWHVLLIAFAPISIVAVIVIVSKEYWQERHSPQYKEQRQWLQQKEREEQLRQASLALYHERYAHLSHEVPLQFVQTAHRLHRAMRREKHATILLHLDKLTLPEDKSLFVRLPDHHHGCGDASRLYVASSIYGQEREFSFLYFDENKEPAPAEERSYRIFHHLHVEDSLMGAWQALLVSQLWHVLPFYWHGEYDQRRYLFTQDDLRRLVSAPRTDCRKLTLCSDDYHVAPECVDAGHGIYYFTWCYWTEWGGLISELHQVTIHDSRATILFLHKETLHRYDCGWML